MVLPSSVNMERLKDGNVKLYTVVNIDVRKWRLLLVLSLAK